VTIAARAVPVLATAAEAADRVVGMVPGAARRQRSSLRVTAHRPWPLPDGPWIMGQTWVDLLFAHWPVERDMLRAAVPPELPLDLFDGRAWISVTPFEVLGTRARGTFPPPGISRFPELNVRTYVTLGDRPGIWFFSLDAGSALAVAAARVAYRLPYFRARMRIERRDGWIGYASRRTDPNGAPARFEARYRPVGPAAPPAPGTLDRWLTERYCLYTLDRRRRVLTADIHHSPWPLRAAEADIAVNTMADAAGVALDEPPALLHFARRQDVLFWPPAEVGGD
jgi:uncharacterized protein YqjF (DUF2071 family)